MPEFLRDNIKGRPQACINKTKFTFLFEPPVAYQVGFFSSCPCNEMNALVKRHIIPRLIEYDPDLVNSLDHHLDHFQPSYNAISFQKYVNQFSGAKRKIYYQAKLDIYNEGIRKKDFNVKMFVKIEKTASEKILESKPRAIQHRDPKVVLLMAKHLHEFEKSLYRQRENGLLVFAKGRNNVERFSDLKEHFDSYMKPTIVLMDHSKFDAHVTIEHLKLTHRYYLKFVPKSMKKVLNMMIRNRCRSKSGIHYKVEGTRMSGDYDTALGNSIINYVIIKDALIKSGATKFSIYLDGDDSVVFVEGDFKFNINFGWYGMETKINYITDFNDIEFCQGFPCPTIGMMVRNPIRALSHMSVAGKPLPIKAVKAYLATLGEGEMHLSSGVPVIYPLSEKLSRLTPKRVKIEDSYKYKLNASISPKAPTIDTRVWFSDKFGISIEYQKYLENTVLKIATGVDLNSYCALNGNPAECWKSNSATFAP